MPAEAQPVKMPVATASDIGAAWRAAWPGALAVWSRFVQLKEPAWCNTVEEEKTENLSGSFAMIRLVDHAVVISLRQVAEQKIERFATEVLAHEIGHHVYAPGDLSDNARLLARTRAGLPTREKLAPMIANLYTDLLINDRLQRSSGLDMAGVYASMIPPSPDSLWTLYMRIYEVLWSLPRGSLATGKLDARLNNDAGLGARLIRSYARDWLDGAGRFACLCLPYVIDDEGKRAGELTGTWHDTRSAGAGGFPDGLAELDEAEAGGAIHPAEDPDLSGVANDDASKGDKAAVEDALARGRNLTNTGRKTVKQYRGPVEYTEVLKASGVTLSDAQIIARYYRERARPYLVRFPVRKLAAAVDPIPEGLDTWDVGSSMDEVDWLATVLVSPQVVPGQTTRRRMYGDSPGNEPETQAVDLYLGVDCSGSMGNPATQMSYPVLAGAIMALSALRAGSRVMVALSGEPGRTITTDGFVRDPELVMGTLTSYLGTGMTFGIHRLADTFAKRAPDARPTHILILTDNDIFTMLDQKLAEGAGWEIAAHALRAAKGGGTYLLQFPEYLTKQFAAQKVIHPGMQHMRADGWSLATVDSMEQLLSFAHDFSRRSYEQSPGRPPANAMGAKA